MTPREKWEQRGRNDYPRCDLFPYRDKHGPRTEKWYLAGWHKAGRSAEIDKYLGRDD